MKLTEIRNILLIIAVALTCLCSCQKEETGASNVDPFSGIYRPYGQLNHIGITTTIDNRTNNQHNTYDYIDAQIQWDSKGRAQGMLLQNASTGTQEIYNWHYNSQNRIDSIDEHSHFYYNSDNRLERIVLDFSHRRTIEMRYSGEKPPSDIITIDEYGGCLPYNTTSAFSLEWSNGDLVKATPWADSEDKLPEGIKYITYTYDDHFNPLCGFFWPQNMINNLLVELPSLISKHNPLTITYHYEDGRTWTSQSFEYTYDGKYPIKATYSFDNLIDEKLTYKCSLSYEE